ncbi:MAG: hypothetical protein HRF43_05865, partial [Phycisphaerae bacterium]
MSVELPVPLAEVVRGVSEEIEQLAGRAGLRIMRQVSAAGGDRRSGMIVSAGWGARFGS